ncbi:MAG: ThiF family adenylyltransferase [Adhaeribacter sp.]
MQDVNLFLEKYSEQIKLKGFGVPGQEALRNGRVLVIGAGALGAPVLTYLAAMGLGTLGIVEPGVVTLSELPAQPYYKAGEVGKPKLDSLGQHLRDINPDTVLQLYDHALNGDNALEIISRFDMVVYASNDLSGVLFLNDACVLAGAPLVFGLAYKYTGLYGVFNFKKSATFRCLQSNRELGSYLQDEAAEGVLGVLPGLVGCHLAAEAVKILSGLGEVSANKLVVYDMLKNEQRVFKTSLNPENLHITTLPRFHALTEESGANRKVPAITPHQLSLKLNYQESVQLIDIREPVAGAISPNPNVWQIPAARLLDHQDKIQQDIPVILISDPDETSRRLTDVLLHQHGFGNIYYLEGGMEAWVKEMDAAGKPGQ